MTWTLKCVQASLACMLVLGIANYGSADLWVYEPFDYAEGSELTDLDGGGGFLGDWTGRGNNDGNVPAGSALLTDDSLDHPSASLPTQGNSVLITGEFGTTQPAREFSTAAKDALAAAPTTWISFLAERQGEVQDPPASGDNPYPRGVNVSFFRQDLATDDELVGVGNSSDATDNTWSIIPDGSGSLREGAYDPAGGVTGGGPETPDADTYPWDELQWAVLRIDHQDGNDDIHLWLSPDPNVEPDVNDAVASISNTDDNAMDFAGLAAVRPFIGDASGGRPFGVLALDELRVGTSYAAMSSTMVVPEPTGLMLATLAGLALVSRRRRT